MDTWRKPTCPYHALAMSVLMKELYLKHVIVGEAVKKRLIKTRNFFTKLADFQKYSENITKFTTNKNYQNKHIVCLNILS